MIGVTSLSFAVSFSNELCDVLPCAAEMTFVKHGTARKSFTPQEDLLLSHLVHLHGSNKWERIAQCMESRNARQCRERWRTMLSPGLVNGPWSKDEDQLLVRLYREHGPRWSLIAKQFHGRSDCNVKNRWARHLLGMNLEYMDDKALAGRSTTPTDFWHAQVSESASVGDTFEFIFGDQVDNGIVSTGSFINW
jgi:hypothetical protein